MKRAPNQPVGELTLYAGIFCKVWTVADQGTLLPQHSHEFAHLSLIVSGAVQVWAGDEDIGVFRAPATIKIPAHTFHRFLTLADDTVIACIHAVGETDQPAVTEASREFAREIIGALED